MAVDHLSSAVFDLMKCSDKDQQVVNYLQHKTQTLGVNRILSVGAGTGAIDVKFLEELPNLKTYIALEPNQSLRKDLVKNVKDMKKLIESVIVPTTIEDYAGPSEPVDLILMIHVCYYFKDTFKTQIKRALQWLRPGGQIIIIYADLDESWTQIYECVHGSVNPLCDFNKQLTEMKIQFSVEKIPLNYKWNLSNVDLLVWLQALEYPNKKQVEMCTEILKKYSDEENVIKKFQLVHVIPQTDDIA